MNVLKRLFHFLGGLPLAIFLIATTALLVIVGTILESKSDSHRYAASLTYGSPLFTLLLCGFFINILFSTLRRWPFQWKHIPFLITHLGLLMVLAGAIIKTMYGVQGHMMVLEGSGSDRVVLPHTESILVEKRDPSLPKLQWEIVDKQPHGIKQRQSWIIDNHLHIDGLKPISVDTPDTLVRFDDNLELNLIAAKTDDVNVKAQKIYREVLETGKPTLAWLQQPDEPIQFFSFDRWNGVYGTELSEDMIVVYDKGFGGYYLPLEFPVGHTYESEAPPIQLFVEAAKKAGIDPQIGLEEYFNNSFNDSVLKQIDWAQVPQEDYKAALWASIVFDRIEEGLHEGFSFSEVIQMSGWPVKAETKQDLLHQIFAIAPQLPDPTNHNVDNSRLLTIFMKLYGVIPPKKMTFESPLITTYKPSEPPIKWEDRRPLLTLKTGDESFSLLFDPMGSELKQPVQNGNYLVRFQPDSVKIPHRLRIRQARQINYPGTNQPYSYEADVLFKNRSGSEEKVTLSMNHVHETEDGYRFYLAGMSPKEDGVLKRVQIVVNYDPVKYLLTYPGACLLVLGVILLFFPAFFRACYSAGRSQPQ